MAHKVTARLTLAAFTWLIGGRLSFSQIANPLKPGDPLPGIAAGETQSFLQGQEAFMQVLEPEDGLGPAFNGASCAGCHNTPAVGGSGAVTVVRAGLRDADGNFHVLQGSTLFQMSSTPDYRCQVHIPAEANVIARRSSNALFGLGLIEAISDETLLALQDPGDLNQDGVHGQAAMITDVATGLQRVGRFGWKAQHATLLAFAADAYRSEMGITNELFPDELAPGVDPQQLKVCNLVPNPKDVRDRKTGLRSIDKLAAFLKYLAPIPRGPVDETVRAGEGLFAWSGCIACHAPILMTGASSSAAIDHKPVALYSDLLLHDLYAGDGIEQGAASGNQMRTTPLWGLRYRRPLWHDGSIATIHEAILRHGGEGQSAMERYVSLGADQQALLLAFLGSL
jgi:CxxC motif-containing protein (DUF1111 family)